MRITSVELLTGKIQTKSDLLKYLAAPSDPFHLFGKNYLKLHFKGAMPNNNQREQNIQL